MKRECPQCGFELRGMNSYERFVHEKLERFKAPDPQGHPGQNLTGFDVWVDAVVGTVFYIPDLHAEVTLVEAKLDYDFEEAESLVYVVLRVGENNHYIQHGSRDSYGDTNWEGEFRAVAQQTRTTWIWEENA